MSTNNTTVYNPNSTSAYNPFRQISAFFTKNPGDSDVFAGSFYDRTELSSEVEPQQALRCAAVAAAQHLVAYSMSQIKVNFPDDKNLQEAWNWPNIYQSVGDLQYAKFWDKHLYGDGFTEIIKKPGGRVIKEFVTHDADNISIARGTGNIPVYHNTATDQEIPAANMIRLRDHATGSIDSIRRIDYCARQILSLIEMDKVVQDNMRNGINIAHLFTTTQDVDPSQYKKVSKGVDKFMAKLRMKSGGYIMLDNGFTIQSVKGLVPAELELRETYLLLLSAVATAWNLPPFFLGAEGSEKYSNQSARLSALHRMVFQPNALQLKRTLEHRLRTTVEIDSSELYKGDVVLDGPGIVNMYNAGVIQQNEARITSSFAPVEGGWKFKENPTNGLVPTPGSREGEMPSDDGSSESPKNT